MTWVFFGVVTGHGFSPKIDFGTECWKCLGPFLGNPGLCLRLVLVPRMMSSGFVVCFGVCGYLRPEIEIR